MAFDLLLDIGNTRSKLVAITSSLEQPFAVVHEEQILNKDLITDDGINFSESSFQPFYSKVENVFCSCVGGEVIRNIWQKYFLKTPFLLLRSYYFIPGFINMYKNPAELGTDRFTGMSGAYDLGLPGSSLIISCGTATTIDFLERGSVFQGGWILPGLDLMLQSLGKSTAQLPSLNTATLNPSTLNSTNLKFLNPTTW
jgi:type III pantothenate kinase